jgi:hypothetical protein
MHAHTRAALLTFPLVFSVGPTRSHGSLMLLLLLLLLLL